MAVAPSVYLTLFSRTEFANAIYQQVFLQRLSSCRSAIAHGAILNAIASTESGCRRSSRRRAWDTSIDLARRYGPTLGVRTLDSLHVACALELRADRFWTFDERQAKLAEAVGLDTSLTAPEGSPASHCGVIIPPSACLRGSTIPR